MTTIIPYPNFGYGRVQLKLSASYFFLNLDYETTFLKFKMDDVALKAQKKQLLKDRQRSVGL